MKSSDAAAVGAFVLEDAVAIREVQHFAYCPHRRGLIHIGCDCRENAFVNKAKLLRKKRSGGCEAGRADREPAPPKNILIIYT